MKSPKIGSISFVAALFLSLGSAFSEVVNFERTSRIVNLIQLNETRIFFDRASELLCEGGGNDGDGEHSIVSTMDNSFLIVGENLFINGRMVIGFNAGEEYTFKEGVLYSRGTKALLTSKEYLDADLGRVSKIDNEKEIIEIVGIGKGGGMTEKCADGYMIWVSSYVCTRIWDGEFYLWGVNYGRVKSNVQVNLKEKTVTIDKGKPVAILMK